MLILYGSGGKKARNGGSGRRDGGCRKQLDGEKYRQEGGGIGLAADDEKKDPAYRSKYRNSTFKPKIREGKKQGSPQHRGGYEEEINRFQIEGASVQCEQGDLLHGFVDSLPEKGEKKQHRNAEIQQAEHQISGVLFPLAGVLLGQGQQFVAG